MREPLIMSRGRKIYGISNCDSPYEIGLCLSHFGEARVQSPLDQSHIVQTMKECRYTIKSMSNVTGISTSVLGKWKKKYCPKSEGVVYILLDRRQSAFKVGLTRGSVESRVKALQTSLAGDLEIFLTIKTLDPEKIEGFLHSFLKDCGKHLNREWFDLDRETTAYLKAFKEELPRKWLKENLCSEIKHQRMWEEMLPTPHISTHN